VDLPIEREVGRHRGHAPGPMLIAVAGIHGNEPAGIEAARRVLARLAKGDLKLRGDFVAFAGNLRSLRRGVRYHDRDLNRAWTEDRVAELSRKPESAWDTEDREQHELLQAITAAASRARGQVYLGDFHSTSAAGIPFILFGDTLRQLHFARAFPLPVILGLEEQLDGVLTEYWTRRGFVTFALEAGQHQSPASVEAGEAVLWLALAQAGLLVDAKVELARSAARLNELRQGLPRIVEVISRRSIEPSDRFVMEPGFRNIDHAKRGQLLARDKSGEIRAPEDGMVVLPLYQGLGGDGYFWGREASPVRLFASHALRLAGLGRLAALLPGVSRDERGRLVASARSRLPMGLLRLLGYRRVREVGAKLTIERCDPRQRGNFGPS
jgi:succinylglutamate desuccinylase